MTMPDTTPSANDTAKIFNQNTYRSRHSARRVFRYAPARNASQLASPIVNAGKMM
jgi:hypothetical protein